MGIWFIFVFNVLESIYDEESSSVLFDFSRFVIGKLIFVCIQSFGWLHLFKDSQCFWQELFDHLVGSNDCFLESHFRQLLDHADVSFLFKKKIWRSTNNVIANFIFKLKFMICLYLLTNLSLIFIKNWD